MMIFRCALLQSRRAAETEGCSGLAWLASKQQRNEFTWLLSPFSTTTWTGLGLEHQETSFLAWFGLGTCVSRPACFSLPCRVCLVFLSLVSAQLDSFFNKHLMYS